MNDGANYTLEQAVSIVGKIAEQSMSIHRLVYIANTRFPTEKAHGYQICKTCEAFAQNGIEVQLWHPLRYQLDYKLRGKSVFDYYGVRPIFQVKTLRNWDVVRLERLFPKRMFMLVFFFHAFLWGLYAALTARKEKADLYYTRDTQVTYWLVRLGMPAVYEAHITPQRGQRRLVMAAAGRPSLKLAVTLADSIRQELLQFGFPSEKVFVQAHGVDLTMFRELPSKEECRKRLDLPLERPIIGYVGSFQAVGMEKGIPELIEAVTCLSASNATRPLLLCVGGPINAVPKYYEFADRLDTPKDCVRFIDRVPNLEVPIWIRACDLVVLPLNQEYASKVGTMPLKLLEYMAAGVPIVASDLPSIRQVLRHRHNAWLTEPGSPKALAEGISRLLRDPILTRAVANQARQAAAEHTWERRAASILNSLT